MKVQLTVRARQLLDRIEVITNQSNAVIVELALADFLVKSRDTATCQCGRIDKVNDFGPHHQEYCPRYMEVV